MLAHVMGLPAEELLPVLSGGTAGLALLYVCGQVGALADRVTRRRPSMPVESDERACRHDRAVTR